MKRILVKSIVAASLLLATPAISQTDSAATQTEAKTEQLDSSASATDTTNAADSSAVAIKAEEKESTAAATEEVVEEKGPSFSEVIKEKIIEGGTGFMSIVLICLILGLAIAIERVITLNLASSNYKKLLAEVKGKLVNDGVDAAKDLCARTKGPIASIYAQGLMRSDEGITVVERSIESYGSAEISKLEKGMTWLVLFISLAPMFGFMGTVIGMIDAFDTIEQAEDIKIDQVAGGIKVALLTTVAGLIVAVILQIFHNYLTSTIDSITGKMEDASNAFVDLMVASGKIVKK